MKAFRMGRQRDVPEPLRFRGIDNRDLAGSETNKDMAASRINAHVIRAITQRHDFAWSEIGVAEKADCPIAAVGDDNKSPPRYVGDTLRLSQTGYPAQHLLRREIDNIERVVAEFCNKQALTDKIDSEVIDQARDIRERNRRFQNKRLLNLLRLEWVTKSQWTKSARAPTRAVSSASPICPSSKPDRRKAASLCAAWSSPSCSKDLRLRVALPASPPGSMDCRAYLTITHVS